jgi:hypothetical protein
MSELWAAVDSDGAGFIHDFDPPFVKGYFSSPEGREILGDLREEFPLKPGQKARLKIGEVVDCNPNPKPVPELWASRMSSGKLIIGVRDTPFLSGREIPTTLIPDLPINCGSRIAWDENGIRLIGTPEPI